MVSKPKIVFRTDGNSRIGLGHIIRTLALADMLSKNFECIFAIQNPPLVIKNQLSTISSYLIDLPITTDYKSEAISFSEEYLNGNEIVVLDGYYFSTLYQKAIKDKGCKLVCVDDVHAYHFLADAVINHAEGITTDMYSTEAYTQYLLGFKHALLRTPFLKAAENRISVELNNNVFICLGGADPNNDTLNVLKKCEKIKPINKYYLVVGSAYCYYKSLKNYIEKSKMDIALFSNLSAEEMVDKMKLCSHGITSASTVAYEYLSVGGVLYLKSIADNQINIHSLLISKDLAFDFDHEFPVLRKEMLKNYLEKQQTIFDGKQAKRFLKLFNHLSLNTRKATNEDCLLYYDWVNDPETRNQSYNSEPISLSQHQSWYYERIEDPNCFLYVISILEQPIGQTRFEIRGKRAIISYSLDKTYRGQGWGSLLLKKGIDTFQQDTNNKYAIVGFVIKDNPASAKAFRRLNFIEEDASELDNSYKYTLK